VQADRPGIGDLGLRRVVGVCRLDIGSIGKA
jgi:hypothetical protein